MTSQGHGAGVGGELQGVLPHFFFTFATPFATYLDLYLGLGRPVEGEPGAALAAFLTGALWVLSVGVPQHPLAVPAPVGWRLGGPSQCKLTRPGVRLRSLRPPPAPLRPPAGESRSAS